MQSNAEYHGGDYIFVPAGEQISDASRLHELSHQFLMKSTHWGEMTYLQTQLRRADRLYERTAYHLMIGDILMQAAETTFESHAVLNELLMLKDESNNDASNRILNGLYYQVYSSAYIETFYHFKESRAMTAYLSGRLPQLALATDLLQLPPECWRTEENLVSAIMGQPALYHPDTRFQILVDQYINLLKEFTPDQISDELLIQKSGIPVKTVTYETRDEALLQFSSKMKTLFPEDECISNAFELIYESIEMGDMEEILEQAQWLDVPLPHEDIQTFQISRLEPWMHECDVMIIMPYHETVLLQYHITSECSRYVCACEWSALPVFLARFKGILVLYDEDFSYMKERNPAMFNRKVFFYYEGTYRNFKKSLMMRGFANLPACLFFIDEKTSCLFVKPEENIILFTIQNYGGTQLILDDFSKGMFQYINSQGESIDEFYSQKDDAAQYENAIKSVLHVKNVIGRCNINFSSETSLE